MKMSHSSVLETLEPRLLMSGNVMVYVRRGVLEVIGDSKPNSITIDQTGLPIGQVRLSAADSDTTLNGQTLSQVFDSVRSLNVRLGRGDDKLVLHDMNYPDSIYIDMGAGNDTLQVGGNVYNCVLLGGSGQDVVTIDGLIAWGSMCSIDTGRGYDQLAISNSQFYTLKVNGGSGNDLIHMQQVVVNSGAVPSLPGHAQTGLIRMLGNLVILAGSGSDTVSLDNASLACTVMKIDLGDGNDSLRMDSVTIPDPSPAPSVRRITGGRGHDEIILLDQTQLQAIQPWLQSFEYHSFL